MTTKCTMRSRIEKKKANIGTTRKSEHGYMLDNSIESMLKFLNLITAMEYVRESPDS